MTSKDASQTKGLGTGKAAMMKWVARKGVCASGADGAATRRLALMHRVGVEGEVT